jgi:hypothetical protein
MARIPSKTAIWAPAEAVFPHRIELRIQVTPVELSSCAENTPPPFCEEPVVALFAIVQPSMSTGQSWVWPRGWMLR